MATAAGGAVEQVVDGTRGIHQHARAGNIHAKHGAIKACTEACILFARMVAMLSRTLGDLRYGPEITEPLDRAAMFLHGAALACGEADTAVESLKRMTVGGLADSPRSAPERSELTESGAI